MATLGGLLGFSAAAQDTLEENSTPIEQYTGPFCVEVYSPHAHRDRSLPIFDNLTQARNLALARMKIIQNDMGNPARDGKILITKPNGAVAECITWGPNWSQTICYVDCSDNNWKV